MAGMTDDQALLAAVLAAPDDDAPRLIYADWLDEHGQAERAEFIRVQCELARVECPGCRPFYPCREGGLCRKEPLRRREREFGEWYHDGPPGWLFIIPHHHFEPSIANVPLCTVRRGFVDEVRCRAADWLKHGDQLAATQPIREVRGTGNRSDWRFWLSTSRVVSDEFYKSPVESWVGLSEVYRQLILRVDDVGRPILATDDETDAAILSARWPSVKTWRLPAPPARPAPPVMQNSQQVGRLENVRMQEGHVVADIVIPGSPGAGRITARIH
jgi:uncharacterized protein (TIGR02996 family)